MGKGYTEEEEEDGGDGEVEGEAGEEFEDGVCL